MGILGLFKKSANRQANNVFITTKTISKNIFSKNLRMIRKRRGLSQYDLADLTGISRRMISHYESDGIIPPIDHLEMSAKTLGVEISHFFEFESSDRTNSVDLSEIDSRSIKKLKDILSLPPEDRNDLYRILNKMLRKNQLEKETKAKYESNR